MRRAGRVVAEMHERIREAIRPGVTLLDLDVDREVVLSRLAGRRMCDDCGANYSTGNPPKYGWVCDNCGGDVVQRDDDKPAAIERRLAEYEAKTAPLIAWYDERGMLEIVEGLGSTDDVLVRMVTTIDQRRGS